MKKRKNNNNNSRNKINRQIRNEKVRLVGDNVDNGLYNLKEALDISEGMGLDLVELSNNDGISICKIMDYDKYVYNKIKNKPKVKNVSVKELRLSPNIDVNDLNIKKKQARKFLSKEHRLKIYVQFKGREFHINKGKVNDLLKGIVEELGDISIVKQEPKLEGRRMTLFLEPKKAN